jgi:hypothetical protein
LISIFSDIFNLNKQKTDWFFITSYRDIKIEGNFMACNNQILPEELKSPDFKSKGLGLCTGLRFHLQQNKALYNRVACMERQLLVCQVKLVSISIESSASS